jgi:hypothetical protein
VYAYVYNKVGAQGNSAKDGAGMGWRAVAAVGIGFGAAREVANAVLCIPNAYSPILTHRMHGQLIYGRNKPPAFPINRKASQGRIYRCRMLDRGIVPLVVRFFISKSGNSSELFQRPARFQLGD